ncbi:MAG TPA: undecaprenyl/decaprenyl-phosphate alpha-N-acetylglucosaminyl 1-phosphate transferase [Firmicutes bacterium]|nr:undecaprenyl/decaprenyl-phosphate alpha-N-acetylglucosaminyl 1-phosphate transferase [Bacillota bacterium]
MPQYILAFLFAFLITYLLTPLVKKMAIRTGAVDIPDSADEGRRIHIRPTPRLGGLAIYLGFMLPALTLLPREGERLYGLLLGATLILLLGIADDYRNLSPRVKLAGQVLAALVFIFMGNRVIWLSNPWAEGAHDAMWHIGSWSIPLTLLWMVGITNTLNLIDGLDGLAAGVTAIASVTLLLVALQEGQVTIVLLTAALAGSTLGFLPYNFNPAQIFMGDTGSLFLGFVLAGIAVQGALKSATVIALAVPILALGLPILDTFLAIVRRYHNGSPIFQADRQHLHHRLLERGLSQRQAVLFLYSISGVFGMGALAITEVRGRFGLFALAFAVLAFFLNLRRLKQFDIRGKNLKG